MTQRDIRTIDTHVMLGTDSWLAKNKPHLSHTLSARQLKQMFADIEPDGDWRAACFPFPSAAKNDYIAENEKIIAISQQDSRVIPVIAANPNSDENVNYIEQVSLRGQIAGIMIWPILSDLNLTQLATNDAFWRLIEDRDLSVTIHTATGDEPTYRDSIATNAYGPMDAVEIASTRPGIRFNLSHALRLSRAALHAVSSLDNVWTDLSGYSAFGRWREDGKEIFPASDPILGPHQPEQLVAILENEYGLNDKILFGSSEPFCRWWNSSLQREYETWGDVSTHQTSSFSAAAHDFYSNWSGGTYQQS